MPEQGAAVGHEPHSRDSVFLAPRGFDCWAHVSHGDEEQTDLNTRTLARRLVPQAAASTSSAMPPPLERESTLGCAHSSGHIALIEEACVDLESDVCVRVIASLRTSWRWLRRTIGRSSDA